MSITPASFLRNRYGRFSGRLLAQDENSLRELYRSNGFREAEVKHVTPIQEDYGGKHGNLAVKIEIHEGEQWLVDKLEIEGASASDEEYLRSNLQSTRKGDRSDSPTCPRTTTTAWYTTQQRLSGRDV